MYRPKLPKSNYKLVFNTPHQTQGNEIHVKAKRKQFYYAVYAGKLLLTDQLKEVLLKGTGQACSKIVEVVEFLRRRIKGLHVSYDIYSTEFVDRYEPEVEGLDVVEIKK